MWSVVDAPFGREQSQRVYAVSKKRFITEVIDTVSNLLVSDITADVGDPSLWLKLAEHLAPVLFDVYRHGLETPTGCAPSETRRVRTGRAGKNHIR